MSNKYCWIGKFKGQRKRPNQLSKTVTAEVKYTSIKAETSNVTVIAPKQPSQVVTSEVVTGKDTLSNNTGPVLHILLLGKR
ncbi:hypothetical protein DPMN_041838 [Dreissena polymorpha]|uniref:Uncharacterized protein n=1 Tax=Dreissena polymorpha TaxID=45954 RepID=A0A9D4CYI3_DREPO|nr:hypothetical protein DPMN_041838 [Dreissena polymorpha]